MGAVLVTGGAGFLGSHLCRRLIGEGRRVICLDNNYTGATANVAPLLADHNFRLLGHDVAVSLEIDEALDRIYNLACPASPVHYQGPAAVFTTRTCVLGALNMLELAKEHGARILQASTSEVYGDPLEHPQREDYRGHVNPIGPRACYDEGKRCAESLFFDYHRQDGVPIKVARIFNTYGPRMRPDDGRVVSNFILQALRGGELTVYGEGSQTRSFCYVDDLIEGLVRLMESPPEVTGPVNLGNPGEFTVLELAEMIIKKIGQGRIVHRPLPPDDPSRRRPDICRARELLGWSPTVDLERGLDLTIDYFRSLA